MLCSAQDLSPWDDAAHVPGGTCYLSYPNLEIPSQTRPEGFYGDSKSYRLTIKMNRQELLITQ